MPARPGTLKDEFFSLSFLDPNGDSRYSFLPRAVDSCTFRSMSISPRGQIRRRRQKHVLLDRQLADNRQNQKGQQVNGVSDWNADHAHRCGP